MCIIGIATRRSHRPCTCPPSIIYHINTSYVMEIVFCVDSFFRILGYAKIRVGYVSAAQKWDIQKKQPARYTNCFLRPAPRSSTPMVVLLRGAGLKKQLMVSTRDPLRGGCAHARTPRKGANLFSPPFFSFLSSLLSLLSSPLLKLNACLLSLLNITKTNKQTNKQGFCW